MSAPGFPADAKVFLDDGTGTYPYDVTQYVRQVDGLSFNRGRQDELSDNQTGQLTVTFDNTDGRFTFGSVTYNVACDQGFRYQVGGVNRFTGKVQSWPVAWPDGSDQFATAAVTVTDELAVLTRRALASATVEEISADLVGTGAALWPLSDDPGSQVIPQAHDVMGVAPTLITSADNPTRPVKFGQPLGTPDGANGVQLTAGTTFADVSDGLQNLPIGPLWTAGIFPSLHFEITYNLAGAFTTGAVTLLRINNGDIFGGFLTPLSAVSLSNNSIGVKRAPGDAGVSATISNYSGLHTIAVDMTSTSTKVWFDGSLKLSTTGVANIYSLNGFQVAVGMFDPGTSLTMTIGNVTIGPSISSSTRIVAHQTTALTDLAGETPAARIARLAGYVGATVGSIDATGDTTCGIASQDGRTAMDCITETADADQGNAYIDGNGHLTYVAGTTFAGLVDYALDANWSDVSTTFTADMQNIVNYATGQAGTNAAVQGPVYDTASITAHGRYPQTYTWNVNTDAQALYRTQWKVANYSEPTPRCATLAVDLLSMDATTRANVLALDLDAFLQLTGLPSQTPGGTSQAFLIVGITETISASEWSVEFNCVQRSLAGAWVLGDATYGVLNTTTKLYV